MTFDDNDSSMIDDDPWHEDEPQTGPTASTAPQQISQQEWEKLSSRYSDVSLSFCLESYMKLIGILVNRLAIEMVSQQARMPNFNKDLIKDSL